ncbi:FkbM family methyltransferase [Alloacidobacterium sp.]|uniref:FkbM family methyltransferase n=1 Tax=Alloacidobacterium sp. TaxID=2951999 RepID=UPI002D5920B4|nr:FkbM family methyltransferase [Alloacidobacterium sp.]HYK37954.1 FkbM family methyltransferase [Alloacidobacterium sp.]
MNTEPQAMSIDTFEVELCSVLNESPHEAMQRERAAFDRVAQESGGRFVLFGAGGFGKLVQSKMASIGLAPLAFADNNPALAGTSIEGIPVYSPSMAAARFGRDALFLVTIWSAQAKDRMSQRIQQLLNIGCRYVAPAPLLFWKYPETFLPYFPLDLPHKALQSADDVKAGFHLFCEDTSRREYVAQVAFRVLLNYDGLSLPDDADHYFPRDLLDLRADEVFIDCGAFDGDTVAQFIRQNGESFGSIVAFEPDPLNSEKLQRRLEQFPESIRRKIVAHPQALGARSETVYFNSDGTDQSKSGSGSIAVECVTLDEALRNSTPTLIKFDIEGAELDALEGAREVIARSRPVLAVSAYHKQDHLWRVPLALQQLCSDYAFFLRPGGSEGWDLICCAIPRERLKQH